MVFLSVPTFWQSNSDLLLRRRMWRRWGKKTERFLLTFWVFVLLLLIMKKSLSGAAFGVLGHKTFFVLSDILQHYMTTMIHGSVLDGQYIVVKELKFCQGLTGGSGGSIQLYPPRSHNLCDDSMTFDHDYDTTHQLTLPMLFFPYQSKDNRQF